jgi:hypothetical protein
MLPIGLISTMGPLQPKRKATCLRKEKKAQKREVV